MYEAVIYLTIWPKTDTVKFSDLSQKKTLTTTYTSSDGRVSVSDLFYLQFFASEIYFIAVRSVFICGWQRKQSQNTYVILRRDDVRTLQFLD